MFPRKSKEPPVDLVRLFLAKFGSPSGGTIRCDQGGELARSEAFRSMCLSCGFVVEPTGADSPSQNGGVERLNGTLAATVRALLYGACLPPQYWSPVRNQICLISGCLGLELWSGYCRVFPSSVQNECGA